MNWWSLRAFLQLFLVPLTSTRLLTCTAILVFLFVFTVRTVSCCGLSTIIPIQLRISELENILLTRGDIHPNPGYQVKANNFDYNVKSGSTSKSKFKFPCKVCDRPVKSNQKGTLCEECCFWHHIKCIGMNHNIYSSLASSNVPWFCCECGPPNFSDSFFDESRSLEPTGGISENDACDGSSITGTVHWKDKISILNTYFSMLGVYETRFQTFKSCCYLIHLALWL